MARRCVFCDDQPVTKEHGLPIWIDKFLPITSPISVTETGDDFVPQSRGERKTISGMEIRAVCGSCNNGWLSDIENEAMPIIGPMLAGRGTVLDKDAQTTVATWVIKTTLILEFADPKRRAYILPLCKLLYAERSPLKYFYVFIGAYGGDKWLILHHFQPLILVNKSESISPPIDTHLSTLAVGNFVAQAFYVPSDEASMTVSGSMKMVWPYEDDFIWPSGPFLNNDQVQMLAQTDFKAHSDESLPDSTEQ